MERKTSPIAGDMSVEDFVGYINSGVEKGAYSSRTANAIIDSYKKNRELRKRDGLTGLYRQELVNPNLFREIVRMQKSGMGGADRRKREMGGEDYVSVVFTDMDGFKPVNDVFHGYEVGDVVLKEFAKIMNHVFSRKTDSLYRRGGDEFVALLPYTDNDSASKLLEKLYKSFEKRKGVALRMLRKPDESTSSYLKRKGNSIEDLRNVIRDLSFSSGVVSEGQDVLEDMNKKELGEYTNNMLIIAAERMDEDKRVRKKGR